MPWNVEWVDQEERIIMLEPVSPWTWDELSEAVEKYHTVVSEKEYTVDVVYKLERNIQMPSANLLPYVQRYIEASPPNRGSIVFVNAPRFINTIVDMTTRVMRSSDNVAHVNSIDEALSWIEKSR